MSNSPIKFEKSNAIFLLTGLLRRILILLVWICSEFLFSRGKWPLVVFSVFRIVPFPLFFSNLFDRASSAIGVLPARVHRVRIVAILPTIKKEAKSI